MYRELQSKDLTAEEFERFGAYIRDHSGIRLEESKRDPLRVSLIARATRWGCTSFGEYFELLATKDGEFVELLNLITINETSFFRFPAQFEALSRTVIPRIIETKPRISRSFRVWSAGCSTGEEPYSAAMTLLDSDLTKLGYRAEVLGTDVSTQALDRARSAVYSAKALAGMPEDLVARHFVAEDGSFKVATPVRSIVDFSYHNLVKEPYPVSLSGNWDVIFCRNVTIYFELDTTRRVVDNLFESLNPGGFLFIGHSETLTSVSERFEPVEADGVFLYRKPLSHRGQASGADMRVSGSARVPRGRTGTGRGPGVLPKEDLPAFVGPSFPTRPRSDVVARHRASHPVDAESARTLAAAGRLRLTQGDTVAALNLARKALEQDQRNVEAHLISAYLIADGGDFATALEECHRTLAINPLVAGARFVLGVIYMRLEEPLRAIAEFKRTLYIDSDFVLARFHLANLYRARGSVDDACREYENALRSLGRNPDGDWTMFMDGFTPEVLERTSERALTECRRLVASR